jgi:ubiquitin C-terminal hydrolase
MSVWRLPPIMIIHLKRFQFTQHFRRKLRNMVVFPVEGLDLSRIVASDDHDHSNHADTSASRNVSSRIIDVDKLRDDCREEDASWISNADDGRSPETLYDLYAVVHHLGALSGGHYVASVRSEKDGKWRIFNDAQVTEICSKDIVDASAYILFYIRRDMRHVKLEDVWDTSSRVGEGVTEDQIDKLVKQRSERCIIS